MGTSIRGVEETLTGLSFLVAEDDLLIASGLREALQKHGSKSVEVVSTVEHAAALSDETRFDVALLDISLPDGETLTFARSLHSKGVRLVFHTGHTVSDVVRSAFPSAIFAQKPVHAGQLVGQIAELMR